MAYITFGLIGERAGGLVCASGNGVLLMQQALELSRSDYII
jgi:hypothetical protein